VSAGGRFTEYANSRQDISSINFRAGCGQRGLEGETCCFRALPQRCSIAVSTWYSLEATIMNMFCFLTEGKEKEIKESSTAINRLDLPIIYQ
jgi:hypothetical protein